jgi:hypothetical protein
VEPRTSAERDDRRPLLVFGAVIAVAAVLFFVLAHDQWFYLDEWDYLVSRHLSSLDDLFRPHNEHWTTLPILAYRGLYRVFRLRTYVPYQAVSIALHLTIAALLLVVMRRSGVRPWVATAAASLFALFGAGSQNIVWGFQMAFTGAVVLGLVQLLLADHDGPLDRRDWIGLAAGAAGLLCSGVAITMVVVVGIAALVRRGWRIAAFHTAPLAAIYVAWWLTMARDSYEAATLDASNAVRFVATGMGATFGKLGQLPGVGLALGLLLVVGLVLAWHRFDQRAVRVRAAMPAALLVGAVVFLAVTALGRAAIFGPEFARTGRYVHVAAALVLPALAVAADAVIRRWPVATIAVIALLLVGIPGNVRALADFRLGGHSVPGWVIVTQNLLQSETRVDGVDCQVLRQSAERHLEHGQALTIGDGRARVFDRDKRSLFNDKSVVFDPEDGNTLTATRGPIDVLIGPEFVGDRVKVCAAAGTLDET